jgi:hypothetical protein
MILANKYSKMAGLVGGFLICLFAFVQGNQYYYGRGIQRPLTVSDAKITVKFLPSLSFQNVADFVLSEPALDPSKAPEPNFYRFYILYVLPGTDMSALIERLRSRPEVIIANPVYLTSESAELIVTNRFIVQFYPSVPRWNINDLNAQHGVTIVDSLSMDVPNLFVLELTGQIDKDVLVTANQYY